MMDIDFLFQLLNESGVSGNEVSVLNLCREKVAGKCEISNDRIGNLYAKINSNESAIATRILIEAHIDEIGFQVTYIDNDGYVYIRPCGGIDGVTLIGSFVEIQCRYGSLTGVVGRKPVHLMKGDEKNKLPDCDSVWIDTGLDANTVKKKVRIGDYVSFNPNAHLLGEMRVTSKAIDNRVGAFILTQIIDKLSTIYNKQITFAFTTQEELGCKGGAVVACGEPYDYVICIDAAFSSDVPDISPRVVGDIRLGEGAVVYRNGDVDRNFVEQILSVAQNHNLKIQLSANYAASGGTNTRNMQLTGTGNITATIGYPVRYMHTPVSMADLRDIDTIVNLIIRILEEL
ncbi:M42 family peptidase [Muribaculaceae bacterium Isolate-105 (HZI)]|mgnify:FL=1|jgi:endoglucanase|uniref:M42 family peptidase n=1 Tax=Bacteroides TaxID=816 RepID=UPI000F4A5477|nr:MULTISPECIES: M42 family peptidase [Bacteroides]ROT12913.1 M42 family peptidase [Muribaculaceae bacterium Isolate-105 (HZI)]